jgi:hypothetical protein
MLCKFTWNANVYFYCFPTSLFFVFFFFLHISLFMHAMACLLLLEKLKLLKNSFFLSVNSRTFFLMIGTSAQNKMYQAILSSLNP